MPEAAAGVILEMGFMHNVMPGFFNGFYPAGLLIIMRKGNRALGVSWTFRRDVFSLLARN